MLGCPLVFVEHLRRDRVIDRRWVKQAPTGGAAGVRRLTAQDAARWAMSAKRNPMVITALLVLDAPIERAALLAALEDELKHDQRWMSRVITPGPFFRPHWEAAQAMAWGEHVEEHQLREPVTLSSLQPWIQRVMRRPLLKQKPLWRLYRITGTTHHSALALRVHHCVADGRALLGLLDALCEPSSRDRPTSASSAPSAVAPSAHEQTPDPTRTSVLSPWRGLLSPLTGLLAALRGAGPAPRLTGTKHLGCTGPLPLEALVRRARREQTRLTPLVLSAVVGGLASASIAKHRQPSASLLALVPVDLRRSNAATGGNRFASALVRIPAAGAREAERLRAAHQALDRLKTRPHAGGWGRWIEATGLLPRFLQRWGAWWVTRQVALSLSSIRGPAQPLTLLGAGLTDLVVWSPASGRIGLSVTLTSYAGIMRIGTLADETIVSDPNTLALAIEEELAR